MKFWAALEGGKKRLIEVAHRRWGKDEIALNWAATAAMTRIGGYWHMLPEYAQARKAIWTAVNPHTGKRRIDESFPQEIRDSTNDQEMFIRFKTGSTWQVIGSDNYNRLVGVSIAGLTGSEWALANPAAWGYLAPVVAENNGWAAFITTPRGRNHAHNMLKMAQADPQNWFAEVSPITATQAISLEIVEQQRREYHSMFGVDAGDALIEQEFFCSFEAAILGAYWGKELSLAEQQGRITKVAVDPDHPVHTAWDLGIDDAMAIWWWQAIAGQIRLIDYYEGHGYGISHYADEIKRRADGKYSRGTDYVPHDAKQREMTSSGRDGRAKQRLEVMIECGLKPKVVAQHNLMDGISAVRQVLGRCWFDDEQTSEGLNALRSYQTEWDDDNKVFKKTPLHNWASHGADAFRTMAMGYREMAPVKAPEPGRMLTIGDTSTLPTGVKQVTLNDLWNNQPKRSRRI